MKLSILIPSTYDRGDLNDNLIREILAQFPSDQPIEVSHTKNGNIFYFRVWSTDVEIILIVDDKTMTIGEKRNLLYAEAKGEYSWQIDSDDHIAPDAIEKIIAAMDTKPDCITFRESCLINGTLYTCDHSVGYSGWYDKMHGFDYVRTPFFKDVIKTEIAKSVPVPHIRYGEDALWSMDIRERLKTEVHINEELYYYTHESSDFKTRYGFDKD